MWHREIPSVILMFPPYLKTKVRLHVLLGVALELTYANHMSISRDATRAHALMSRQQWPTSTSSWVFRRKSRCFYLTNYNLFKVSPYKWFRKKAAFEEGKVGSCQLFETQWDNKIRRVLCQDLVEYVSCQRRPVGSQIIGYQRRSCFDWQC